MYFANPWGLLALAAVPFIVFIHLFQRRFPPLEVAGLFLWLNDERVKTSGQRIDRLPVTWTLLLELLAATMLGLLLSQPRWIDSHLVQHVVVVLDNSASMLARDGEHLTSCDRAVAEVDRRMRAAGRNARVTLIATGRRPAMLAGPAATWEDAATILADWSPQDTRHDFDSAWDMAQQLADSGQLLFITDALPEGGTVPKTFEVMAFGAPAANLAFETARWSLDPKSLQGNLYLRIKNYSSRAASATMIGRSVDREVVRRSLEFGPGATVPMSFDVPGGIQQLVLELESPMDALPTDSRITLIEPQSRTLRISNELPDPFPGRPAIDRVLQSLDGIEVAASDAAHLRIGTRALAAANPEDDRWRLTIGPIELDGPQQAAAVQTAGPFLMDRRNELVEGVSMEGVIWAGVQPTESIPLNPLVSATPYVLVGQSMESPTPHFFLNVDLSKSNLVESPAWPILINNMVESCRDSLPGLRQWNYRVDELITFQLSAERLGASATPLLLKSGGRERKIARAGTIEIPPLLQSGVFELRDGEQSLGTFATNFFDAAESDLSQLAKGVIPRDASQGLSGFAVSESPQWLWLILIGLALSALFADWAILRRDVRREAL